MSSVRTAAASAPGKVLLTGGYLVLDRNYTGLVFGLDARIHVHVQPLATSPGVVFSEITVRSPQFQDAIWEYGYRLSDPRNGVQITQLRADADLKLNRNPFVEVALGYALSYIASVTGKIIPPSSITILADNDYYSTPSKDTSSNQRFHEFGVPLSQAHKTGLGSSAALVTAFTAAVLSYYLPKEEFDLEHETSRRRLHNLAQASHCAAQGKVGSGFDVASAVYGNCVYRRFSPSILANHIQPGTKGFGAQLRETIEETGDAGAWDMEIQKDAIKVPGGLRLVMCDVDCGSQTPGMVKKVLAWRVEQSVTAEKIWHGIQECNEIMAVELRRLAESGSNDYTGLRRCILNIRKGIREMSDASGVPVEPPAQTRLLDACSGLPGVIGGVVPGAGGYDAVALLLEDRPEVISGLEKMLAEWRFEKTGDVAAGGKVRMLGVREEMQGIRAEGDSYEGWKE